MAQQPSPVRERLRGTFPKMIEIADEVIYGDIWERPGLSKRDRSLIVVATLLSMYRPEQLRGHLGRALDNGVTKEEIAEVITHLAFYAGWPAAVTARGNRCGGLRGARPNVAASQQRPESRPVRKECKTLHQKAVDALALAPLPPVPRQRESTLLRPWSPLPSGTTRRPVPRGRCRAPTPTRRQLRRCRLCLWHDAHAHPDLADGRYLVRRPVVLAKGRRIAV